MQYAVTSLRLIADHPWIGVGTGGYATAYSALIPTDNEVTKNPHNQYLLTTTQFGLIGGVTLLMLFIVLWRSTNTMSLVQRLQARGFLIAYLIGNLFNSFLYDHAEAHLFAWGIGVIFSGIGSEKKSIN